MSCQNRIEIEECQVLTHYWNSSENMNFSDLFGPCNLFIHRNSYIVHQSKSLFDFQNNICGRINDLILFVCETESSRFHPNNAWRANLFSHWDFFLEIILSLDEWVSIKEFWRVFQTFLETPWHEIVLLWREYYESDIKFADRTNDLLFFQELKSPCANRVLGRWTNQEFVIQDRQSLSF
jgi:hypothetical protein